VAHLDALGRTFLTIEDNGVAGSHTTRLTLDIEGNPRAITDARQNEATRHVFAMGGRALWQKSCDAGQRWMLADVGGATVWEHSGLVEERIYLGGWEVYRKRDSRGFLLLERETLHGMDGARRILLVETKTVDVDAVGVFTPVRRMRFQLDNHLGSASLEVDESGLVIRYEEYHPYACMISLA
jgi:hypothetical protein